MEVSLYVALFLQEKPHVVGLVCFSSPGQVEGKGYSYKTTITVCNLFCSSAFSCSYFLGLFPAVTRTRYYEAYIRYCM